MADEVQATGCCLCGAVEAHVEKIDHGVGACHCSMCRRWGGGPLLAVDCGTEVSFKGEDAITRYNSSEWAERGFCRHCGTHLFYHLKANGQYIMPVGLFGDSPAFEMDHQVFVDERPAYYRFANLTKEMTGAEVFAMYAPPSQS